ncbi:sensor histidine kinase [Elongatibacter sediminis]|uniref:Histidine kinase n=1 Tax=Elongatibacter sediminis TaxID=3119006 RepID=A0AAW9R619_9GAMM
MSLTRGLDSRRDAAGVYPPSFCGWRLLLAVMGITELAVLLVGFGKPGIPGLAWLGLASLYAQWLSLFCASGLCVTSGWIARLSPRGAWIGIWLLTVLLAVAFSHAAWRAAVILDLDLSLKDPGEFILETGCAVGLMALAFFRYLLMRARWRAELLAQSEARVQALQARIQPHFLFNSLNTIASLIPVDPENAETAIEDLADIFRGSMRRADEPIPLEQELQLARQYLDMERRRLGERLDVDWRVEELPGDASVLPLILQPLLENAVGHGIQPRPQGGRLTVYGRAEGDQVVVTIANPVAPPESHRGGHGIALDNISERLKLAFGSRASLVTYNNDEQFYVVLSLPYVKHTDR